MDGVNIKIKDDGKVEAELKYFLVLINEIAISSDIISLSKELKDKNKPALVKRAFLFLKAIFGR